jgi:hypothetical protein
MDDIDVRAVGGAMQVAATTALPVVIKHNAAHDALINQYTDLVDNVSRVISRFGVVLNTQGFNAYQRSEIELQKGLEQGVSEERSMRFGI